MWREIYHEFRRWAKASSRGTEGNKRIEITVETDSIWIIQKSRSTRGWCTECGREVDMAGPKEIGAFLQAIQPNASRGMLPSGLDSKGWHWSQATDGSPLICMESVLKSGIAGEQMERNNKDLSETKKAEPKTLEQEITKTNIRRIT